MAKKTFLFVILVGFIFPRQFIFANDQPIMLTDAINAYSVGPYLEIAEDAKKSWHIRDILSQRLNERFQPNSDATPYLKYTKSAYWVKFDLMQRNSTKSPQYFLEINNSILDQIDLFVISPSGTITRKTAGDIFPFKSREILHRKFVFELPSFENGGRYSIILRFESTSTMRLPITLVTRDSLVKESNEEQTLFGIYIGLILAIVFYSTIVFLFLKDVNYLLFLVFSSSYGLYLLSLHGVGYQFLWPEQPFVQKHAMLLLGGLTMAAASYFTSYFLSLRTNSPLWDKIMRSLGTISLPFALFLTSSGLTNKYLYMYIFVLLTVISGLYSSVFLAFKRLRMAYYYLLAHIIPGGTAIVYGLSLYRFIELNDYIFYSPVVGSVFQMLLLAVGLSDRMRIALKVQKESQALTIKLLQQNEEHKIRLIQKEMNPHFLFNALDSVYYLLEKDRETAGHALIMLSENYRFLLSKTASKRLIGFEEEWRFIDNYLKIECLLFGNELSIEYDKDENLNEFQIPPLTLQPIVENCLKHGFRKKRQSCRIVILVKRKEDGLHVDVIDNGTGLQSGDVYGGTLGKIVKRLQYFYKDSRLTIDNNDKEGVTATFFLPSKKVTST